MKNKRNLVRINKPWGSEVWLDVNDYFAVKFLLVRKGHKLSKQYHKYKYEFLYLISGKIKVTLNNKTKVLRSKKFIQNSKITIKPNEIHRIEGIEDSIILEVSTPQLDDVIRLEDDYGRTK